MTDEERKRISTLWQQLTIEQRAYLVSIGTYHYTYSSEHIPRLAELGLVAVFGRLVVLTDDGRAVANLS